MIIFADIEIVKDFEWCKVENIEKYWDKINFMPEMNRILCIVVWTEKDWDIITKVLKWYEKDIIEEFFSIISKNKDTYICWFNIVNFDIPFIVKRALKYQIEIPEIFRIFWKPKRELKYFLDLKEMYSYWVFWSFWNLDLCCNFLWITSPKDEWIDWSLVQKFYDDWKEEEIYEYCKRDVIANIKLYEYFKNYKLI